MPKLPVITLFIFSTFFYASLYAENYLQSKEKADRRYSFAEMYLGLDTLYFPELSQTYDQNEQRRIDNNGFFPRISLGATHFWGHADFYVNFSFTEYRNVRVGIETGFHYYPWNITNNTLRPFIGISWMLSSFKQTFDSGTEGIKKDVHLFPLIAGLSYQNTFGQIDFSFRYYLNNEFEYNISSSKKKAYRILPYSLALGYKYLFDVSMPTTKRLSKIRNKYRTLKKTKSLSGFAFGIGPSSAFTLREFKTDVDQISFLNAAIPSTSIVPDVSVGYHFYPIDSTLNLSYRFIQQRQDGFEIQQLFTRHAVALEFIKFLFDYHGFVPFVGTGIEYNHLTYKEKGQNNFDIIEGKLGIPIVFGWDIRPYRAISWILRTTLRYNPLLILETSHREIPFDHFEFNFIQFVFYPGRV